MLLSTFSVAARCPRTGQLGIALATAVPAAGPLAIHVRAGVGAIATQAWVNPYLGIDGLELLANGSTAQEALDRLLLSDAGREDRQVGMVDAAGRSAAFSGTRCPAWFGHSTGPGWAVQGNILVSERTIADMAAVAENSLELPLAERLVQVLEAGQAAGGDARGRQCAALKVCGSEDYALVDLRVDDHDHPVAELRRLFELVKLQLLPLVEGLPTRQDPIGAIPPEIGAMLSLSPQNRPRPS